MWQQAGLRKLLASRTGKRLAVLAVTVLGLAALNMLLYGFAVLPAAARLAERQTRYVDLKRQYAEALQFQKQKKALSGLRTGAPTQKDVPLLIKDLAQTARRLGLSVGAINSDIPQPGAGGMSLLAFTVPVSGSYANIKRFIFDIETTDRMVGIQDLKLDSDRKTVKLDLKLVTYLRGE